VGERGAWPCAGPGAHPVNQVPIKKDHFRQWAAAATAWAFDFNRRKKVVLGKKENLLRTMQFLPNMLLACCLSLLFKG
jgi:hypothetical protein